MKTQTDKATAKPIRIYESSVKSIGYNFSVCFPCAITQWFNTRKEAVDFIIENGGTVYVEVPSVTISKAEYAALCSVAESIQNDRQNGMRISTETLNALDSLATLPETKAEYAALRAVVEAASSVSRVLETYKDAHGSWQQINYLLLVKSLTNLVTIQGKQ